MTGYVGSREEYVDDQNREWWSDDPALGPYEVRCPECSEATPDVLMCRHDEADTGPLCAGCCQTTHPRQCLDCMGTGHTYAWTGDGTRAQVDGTGHRLTQPCPACNGTGRLNEKDKA